MSVTLITSTSFGEPLFILNRGADISIVASIRIPLLDTMAVEEESSRGLSSREGKNKLFVHAAHTWQRRVNCMLYLCASAVSSHRERERDGERGGEEVIAL